MSGLTSGERDAVAARLESVGVELAGPLAATQIAGGRSNLTFRLDDGISRWVLRMPPRTGRTPSAHDVAREHRVTGGLRNTAVPIAAPVLLQEDERDLGSPYTVADFVEGTTIQSADDLDRLDDATVRSVVDQLVETLAALHRVDHVAIGLERFGRPDGYAARQVRRWAGQWELVGTAEPDARRAATELAAQLARLVPGQVRVGIVHGDYRIDNTILRVGEFPSIAAVVDWELSTIGDPAADVALMCAYRNRAFDLIVGAPSAWTSDRLPEPDELAAAYETLSGRTLSDWDFHVALAHFKVAVIAAGIDHRRREGSGAGDGFDTAGQAVLPFLEAGLARIGAVR
ncbi:phosphotransferase family protein [Nocardioides endophyticus]|uniref:Phosphotransferase family protein n=1 Tax=Nocardioides endophyticus TaxID=1353775 RepID=A0ABP8YFI2_9ACTN